MDNKLRQALTEGKYKPIFMRGRPIVFKSPYFSVSLKMLMLLKEATRAVKKFELTKEVYYNFYKDRLDEKAENSQYTYREFIDGTVSKDVKSGKIVLKSYTYQDWLQGILSKPGEAYYFPNSISHDELKLIWADQAPAYQKRVYDCFQILKGDFLDYYKRSLIPKLYLKHEIEKLESEAQLDLSKDYFPESIEDFTSSNLSWDLTKKEVDEYLSFDYEREEKESSTDFLDLMDYIYGEEGKESALVFAAKANFLEWLYWFRDREAKTEPTVSKDLNLSKSRLELRKRHLTWAELFKDPQQANIIVVLVSEYLSETGQWNTGNAGRYLTALYLELKEKGYLRQGFSASQIATAFNKQFGTSFGYKIYEPEKSKEAEFYREYFKHIPTLKTSMKS